jgi:hypothetical protein
MMWTAAAGYSVCCFVVVVLRLLLSLSLLLGRLSELRRRSALEEMIQQNATQKLIRQEILKGTYNCKRK